MRGWLTAEIENGPFWVILEKQPDRAAQAHLTYSSTSFAVDTDVDAGSRKVAFPHRGAKETGRRGGNWLRRRFRAAPSVAGRTRAAWASGRGDFAGCGRRLCRPVLPAGEAALGTY